MAHPLAGALSALAVRANTAMTSARQIRFTILRIPCTGPEALPFAISATFLCN
jgi:hypothetical protein